MYTDRPISPFSKALGMATLAATAYVNFWDILGYLAGYAVCLVLVLTLGGACLGARALLGKED